MEKEINLKMVGLYYDYYKSDKELYSYSPYNDRYTCNSIL